MPPDRPGNTEPPNPPDETVDQLLAGLAQREARRSAARDEAFMRRFAGRVRRGKPRPRRRRRERQRGTRRRPLVPLALATALLVLAMSVYLVVTGREDSRFLLRSGEVLLVADPLGPVIRSSPDGEFVYTMKRGRVTLYGRGEARILLAGSERVRLDAGEVWFHVEPGSGNFMVDTEHGSAEVLGTTFGIRVTPASALLRVVNGSVAARTSGGSWTVPAGEAFRLQLGLAREEPESSLQSPPDWVWDLQTRAAGIDWQALYPSRSPHE